MKDYHDRRYRNSKERVNLSLCEDIRVIDMSEFIDNYDNTAAIINALDLVITVDTGVLHLAGALGKEVWRLIPYNPDWRWGLYDEKTIWYPNLTLFRQEEPGNWETVFEKVRNRLNENLLQNKR